MLAPWRLYLYFTSIIQAQVVTVVVLYLCCKNPWRAPQGKKSEQHFSESTKRHVTSEDEAVTARTHKKDKLEWFFSFPAWGLLCEIVIYVLYPLNATSSTYKLPFFFFFLQRTYTKSSNDKSHSEFSGKSHTEFNHLNKSNTKSSYISKIHTSNSIKTTKPLINPIIRANISPDPITENLPLNWIPS